MKIHSALATAALLLAALPARAQEAAPGSEPAAPEAATEPEAVTDAAAEGRLTTLESENRALKERLDAVEARLDDVEIAAFEASAADDIEKLTISGFFDVSFARFFVDDDGMFEGLVPEASGFFVQHLNLYLSSQMTETVSALAEIRFTPLPLGAEESFEVTGFSEYERVDTSYTDYFTNEEVTLGGIAIERVHLTWRPKDWIGVLVGRFLTPYGIWNVDHGTPILPTIRYPYMQTLQLLPNHQTGLQIFGRLIPADGFFVDYVITASNGRGPIEAVWDLDENKGLGARLRASYETSALNVSLGGYGYMGDYTDIKKTATVSPVFDVEVEKTVKFTEYALALDARVETHGVLIQAEWARALYKYELRPWRASSRGPGYQPDYVAMSTYGLLAWTLPIEEYIGGVMITPYAMYEYTMNDDTAIDYIGTGRAATFGLNVKPIPAVAIKAEYAYKYTTEIEHQNFHVIAAQVAVAF